MDNFENLILDLSQMSKKEYLRFVEEKKPDCICPTCPTYNECSKENSELLYCLLDLTEVCVLKEAGCICPACPLTESLGLSRVYFCVQGSEKNQRAL